ncbi:hypothetical protein Csa_017731 [Cucumis sativus]|nr:hypothetical protein Csa_017731 [Cucumis sativus]
MHTTSGTVSRCTVFRRVENVGRFLGVSRRIKNVESTVGRYEMLTQFCGASEMGLPTRNTSGELVPTFFSIFLNREYTNLL